MNDRSLFVPWLASAALAMFLANAIISHDPPPLFHGREAPPGAPPIRRKGGPWAARFLC